MKKEGNISKILTIVPEIKSGMKKSIIIGFLYELLRFTPLIIVKLIVDLLVESGDIKVKLLGFIGGVLASYVILTFIDYAIRRKQFIWGFQYETLIL